ncbi:aldehyde dehydrogenase family protein [Kordiimonas sp. SCSIO 12610]|uniref:aldehyde dehydrogenase family protein n=1 Tax=Kordiimonas sp. SCSIO 12610 TaxID=2829597 RepID=UPI002109336E|nr:aldehyde dehydrogenase family protein [Kordiimonas sp. SCSIO 12610]UTW54684.1 aldehyde dehydrogenase family protein [Kordiimonas sp. SCSIO 12610]
MTNFDNYINGEWVGSGKRTPNINPSNVADVIGHFASATSEETEVAIQAAKAALPAWQSLGIQARSDMLRKAGELILERSAELGKLLAREEGKTLPEGIGEAGRAGHIFLFFAAEVLRVGGDILPSVRPGLDAMVEREPVGVVGLITPWNFPIAIPAWKVAPALAYGNTVVLKPAELVPGCAHAIAGILDEVGLPKGVFNLVCGKGSVVGEHFVNSQDVHAISFTGSVNTGRNIAAKCAATMKKFQLEMGGKNPLVILDDADLDIAVDCAVQGAFYSTGQRCTASSRLIVTEGIYDAFLNRMIEATSGLKVGDALDSETQIGPVVDQRQLDQDLRYINIAQEEGAKLVAGGKQISGETEGFYLEPTLFAETKNSMVINQEEVFGPVATIIKVKDYTEALAVANDTDFGLSSGICTSSLKYASDFRKNAKAGMVMVNLPTAGVDYHVPFGGTKGSSYGPREQGTYAREFYTTVKTSYIRSS